MSFITTIEEHRNMRKNQTTRTTLAPSSPSSPSIPSSPLSSLSSSPQKSPTSSPRKSKPMLGLGFGGVPYRASIPICGLKVPNEREKRDVGSSVMGGGGAAGVENDRSTVSLNSSSSNKTNQQEPDTPSTNSPQTPTDISGPFSYHGDLGGGKTRTRTFDPATTMRDLNLKNSDNNGKNNTDESEEDDHNDNDHNNNTNNNTKNNNNDHHHELNTNPNPSLFNPTQIPKPTFQDLEEPYGGTKHFMMAHGLKWYDSTDCAIREEILGQLRDMEWQNRVNDAREEFVRMEGNGR